MATRKSALVVGDTGICGRHLVRQLQSQSDWHVSGLSRTHSDFTYPHIAADLLDRTALNSALKSCSPITHLFYVGRSPQSDPQTECDINSAMMINVVEAIDNQMDSLEHVHVMQGMKWYGSHAGRYRTPAREDDNRHPSPNFYYVQQDWLSEREPNNAWSWSALRPHQVVGYSDRYPHNITAVLALYGSFCRHKGLPFDFPGSKECYESISMVTDAGLLADAMVFAATTQAAQNRAFNVGNGDYFRWCNVWAKLAEFFDVPCGDLRTHSLHDEYETADADWQAICNQYGLNNRDMHSIGNWLYGDFTFRAGWDDMASFSAINEAGFVQWRDSERVIIDTLQTYRDNKIIP